MEVIKEKEEGVIMDYSIPIPMTHPGVILQEEFIKPLNLTQAKLAELLNVGIKTVNEIIKEKRSVTPVMALRLSKLFSTTPQYWLNFQDGYDLYKAYKDEKDNLNFIQPFSA